VPSKRCEFKKQEYSYSHKQDISSFAPSTGSSKPDKPALLLHDVAKTRPVGDRWSSLKAYRRAQGLCKHCAEKWTKDHRCADKIHLCYRATKELKAVRAQHQGSWAGLGVRCVTNKFGPNPCNRCGA
jgi:hypothetical protein